ncbi:hypothetical protein ABEB36_011169 [Hypothenemus hampei]|uniref:WASH complex subunit 4 n=1 Tax=Hypothenemus hampei TaxID=57062 RepID=A0ABD1EEI0_HYPHA
MWQSTIYNENWDVKESQKFLGEEKLHQFGEFCENYASAVKESFQKFGNVLNLAPKPILTDEQANESLTFIELTYSDDSNLSRILRTLAGICTEIEQLKQEAEELYTVFLYFWEDVPINSSGLKSISQIIEPLQRTQNFIKRSRYVIVITLKQLSCILEKGFYVSNSTSSFAEIIHLFADLLICFLKFDVLLDNSRWKNNWHLYKTSIKNLIHKNSPLGFDVNELRSFSNILLSLENLLLSGSIFKDSVDKCLDNNLMLNIKKSTLNVEFYNFISSRFIDVEKDENNIYTDAGIQINVLVAFYSIVFGNLDKKFIKKLLDLNKKMSAYVIVGNIIWYPEKFLLKHIVSPSKVIDEKTIDTHRLAEFKARIASLPKETNKFSWQACHFVLNLENIAKTDVKALKVKQLIEINDLLHEGLNLFQKIKWTVNWLLNIHMDKNLQVTKTMLNCISRSVEVLKCIYISFERHMLLLNYIFFMISQYLQHIALFNVESLKKNHIQSKSYKDEQLYILSCLKVCENALKGPNTKSRILVTSLALSASGLPTLSKIRYILRQLETVSKFTEFLKDSCDCSMLYWHLNYMLPVYFSKLVASKSNLSKCSVFLRAVNDCKSTKYSQELLFSDVNDIMKDKLCWPLSQIIETNLRHQAHLHLELPPLEPFQNYFSPNFEKLFPILLNNTYKGIKNDVEHSLSTTFYNLTTVVLHDWKTYREMRCLASLEYKLETVDDDLPMQSFGHGLDVLEIMRNINVFVKKYFYNLNTQNFIEARSNNKHLNTIDISHIANSIRSHGIGVMNTTVNYTYQFLKNKFKIFSQFLFDEQIKSRLLKDLKHYEDHKSEFHYMYPYERANKFNEGIRKLGSQKTGESYLDLFRMLITQIGNAMGYVRLIRSGGNQCLAQAACFIPDLSQSDSLNYAEKEELSTMTHDALKILIKNLKSCTETFDNSMEYFNLFVKAFLPHFRNPNNTYLKLFYIIVPPLTINFVEHSLICKERLYKKEKADCAFTDDGFALGLAYIIELLDQEYQLDSLHWFDSVEQKFAKDKKNLAHELSASNSDDVKLKQTLTLTEQRIKTFIRVSISIFIF